MAQASIIVGGKLRRKPGTLLPLELQALAAAAALHSLGVEEAHGYLLAREMQELSRARLLVAHGTLYKALDRLERAGLLQSRWEDPLAAARESRPRRRLYRLTAQGSAALAREHGQSGARSAALRASQGGVSA